MGSQHALRVFSSSILFVSALTQPELTNKLAQAQAELKATMDGLHNARVEIENLKEISQKTKKDKK